MNDFFLMEFNYSDPMEKNVFKTLDNKDKLAEKTDSSKKHERSKKSSSKIPQEPNLENEGRMTMPSLVKWEQMM